MVVLYTAKATVMDRLKLGRAAAAAERYIRASQFQNRDGRCDSTNFAPPLSRNSHAGGSKSERVKQKSGRELCPQCDSQSKFLVKSALKAMERYLPYGIIR